MEEPLVGPDIAKTRLYSRLSAATWDNLPPIRRTFLVLQPIFSQLYFYASGTGKLRDQAQVRRTSYSRASPTNFHLVIKIHM